MTHKRKEIKAEIKTIVVNALDGIVDPLNIKIQPVAPVQDDSLPAVHIYIRSENVEEFTTAPREVNRFAEVLIEIFAKANTGVVLDEFLDDASLLVENSMGLGINENLNGIVDDSILVKTEVDADHSGRHPMGAIRMTYQIQTVLPTDIGLEADDLESIHAKWNISESDPDNATDQIIYT